MRIPTLLLVVPLVTALLNSAAVSAQTQQASTSTQANAASDPISVRWNRLVPTFIDQNAANRRAVRAAAKAAGDTATLRRLAQNQPPFLFRIYTLVSIAQYGAANAARDNRAVSSEAAVAAASAAVLTQLYPDSAVRASIAAELARDIDHPSADSRGSERAAAGKHLGEDVASQVIAWAPPQAPMAGPWSGT